MTCDICGKEIGTTQLRHSNGHGNYHMVCEFNVWRSANGWPPLESAKRVKYYSGLEDMPVPSHKNVWKRKAVAI